MEKVTRRLFVTSVGAATMAPTTVLLSPTVHAAPPQAPPERTQPTQPAKTSYVFFDSEEALFIEAGCDRLIPADESGPGALGAGVPNYLDKQLGGAWGAGERLYRSGPSAIGVGNMAEPEPLDEGIGRRFERRIRPIRRCASAKKPFRRM